MCGIAGIIDAEKPVSFQLVQRMSNALAHRGPDDAGTWLSPDRRVGLGHRRLAIIDPSPLGHQPMCSDDGQIAIVFNGEIYNFQEVRAELQARGNRFRSASDTEVVIARIERGAPRASIVCGYSHHPWLLKTAQLRKYLTERPVRYEAIYFVEAAQQFNQLSLLPFGAQRVGYMQYPDRRT